MSKIGLGCPLSRAAKIDSLRQVLYPTGLRARLVTNRQMLYDRLRGRKVR
jgi:hypothetical protein